MSNIKKTPKHGIRVRPRKRPRTEEEPTHNNEIISWHISLLEVVEPFGWHAIERDKLQDIREKLSHFENRTWNEILIGSKKQNHMVAVSKLCQAAQERLLEIKQDDIADLVSLRLSSRERIWGIRAKHVFKILWWDPNHLVCPSHKK